MNEPDRFPDAKWLLTIEVSAWARKDGSVRVEFTIPEDKKSFTIVERKRETLADYSEEVSE